MSKDTTVVDPGQFVAVMDGAIRDHMAVAKEAADEDIQATADHVVAELKAVESPKRVTGRYSRGWKAFMHRAADGSPYVVIRNKADPGLTHLLEHGHGGPHPAKAFPHIELAYQHGVRFLGERLGT